MSVLLVYYARRQEDCDDDSERSDLKSEAMKARWMKMRDNDHLKWAKYNQSWQTVRRFMMEMATG